MNSNQAYLKSPHNSPVPRALSPYHLHVQTPTPKISKRSFSESLTPKSHKPLFYPRYFKSRYALISSNEWLIDRLVLRKLHPSFSIKENSYNGANIILSHRGYYLKRSDIEDNICYSDWSNSGSDSDVGPTFTFDKCQIISPTIELNYNFFQKIKYKEIIAIATSILEPLLAQSHKSIRNFNFADWNFLFFLSPSHPQLLPNDSIRSSLSRITPPVPDTYLDFIKNPLNIDIIQMRLLNGYYDNVSPHLKGTIEIFIRDLQCVFENIMLMFPPSSSLYCHSFQLLSFLKKLIHNLPDQIQPIHFSEPKYILQGLYIFFKNFPLPNHNHKPRSPINGGIKERESKLNHQIISRLSRRAGLIPDWYPSAWLRNSLKRMH